MQHPDEGTLHAWLDGELDARHAADIEAHVAQCAACNAAVTEAREFRATSDRLIEVLDPGPIHTPARTPRRASGPTHRRPRWYAWVAPLAAAATVVLVIQLNRSGAVSYRDAAAPEAAAPAAVQGAATTQDTQATGLRRDIAGTEEERNQLQEKDKKAAEADLAKRAESAPVEAVVTTGADQNRALRAQAPAAAPPPANGAKMEGREIGDLPTWKPKVLPEQGAGAPTSKVDEGKEIGDLPSTKPQVVPDAQGQVRSNELDSVLAALGGTVHNIYGWTPTQVRVLPARADADSQRTVRMSYGQGATAIVFDQRRLSTGEREAAEQRAKQALVPRDQVSTLAANAAVNQLTWIKDGFEFRLMGPVSSDSLEALKAKVK